jgi:zinc protease
MKQSFRWIFLLLLMLAAQVVASAQATAPQPRKVASVEGITEYHLENGLRVLLFPDPTRPKVTINLTVLVGSRHEGYGETGMAHLLEHMVFKGTPTHPDIPGAMKERGAQFNGSTWVDRTNYHETLPASDQNLEFAIKLEADRMINSPIKADDLATEFSVVRNEFESGENSPERVLSQRMTAVAYEWHNYGKSTIGNRSDIERVPVDNLREFYRRFYQPDNAVLVVAGKFDETRALEYINKYFGTIGKSTRKLPQTYTEEPPQDGERMVTLRRVGDVGLVGLLFHVPAASHAEFPAVEILGQILSSEPSGRLYKALVETKKATSVSVDESACHDPGSIQMMAEVGTKDPRVLESVRDDMLTVVEAVAQRGVTQEEVDRARQRILKNRELAAADPNRIAIELSEWSAQGDWRLYFLNRDRIEQVTPEQVKQVAASYFMTSNRTVGFFIPTTKAERTPIPAVPDIAKLVDGYAGRQIKAIAKETTDVAPMAIEARLIRPEPIGGMRIAFLPKKTRNESVHLRMTLHYGNAENLKGFTEAGGFLPELMTRGTKELTRQQIQDLLDKNFVRLGTGMNMRGMRGFGGGGGSGQVTFTIETKREHLSTGMEMLRQVVREPSLPYREFEVMKNEQITGVEQGRSDPIRQALNQIQRILSPYPSDDVRYVPTLDEQIDRLKKCSSEQVSALYHDYLGADRGEIVIIGDFDPSEVLPVLAKTLEGWAAGKPYARIERPFQENVQPQRETIATPDKDNAVYIAGMSIPMKDDHPDYAAVLAGNFILGGGGLSSRLADRLRQKGGLSYTAMSMFQASPLDVRAELMILAIYNPSNREKVVAGVEEELERLVREGVTKAELDRAKTGYLQQQSVMRTNDSMLANLITNNLFIGRTMSFQADLEQKIKALTPEVVNAALRKHLDPKRLSTITAGDFNKK